MQSSFFELEYAAKKKVTQHDRFLAEIEAVTPWTDLVTVLEPFYPKGEGRGLIQLACQKLQPRFSISLVELAMPFLATSLIFLLHCNNALQVIAFKGLGQQLDYTPD